MNQETAINELAHRVNQDIRSFNYVDLVSHDMVAWQQAFRRRGAVTHAIDMLADIMIENARRRLQDPLFDLRMLAPRFDRESLEHFVRSNPPCDLLQEYPGNEEDLERDYLWGFQPRSGSVDPSDGFRTLQAQQHLIAAHIDWASLQFRESSKVTGCCPFFTACNLPTRTQSPATCRTTPWEAFVPGEPLCWYGLAVASATGEVTGETVINR